MVEIVSFKNTADGALRRLGAKSGPAIMSGLRAAAGFLARRVRASLVAKVPSGASVTTRGRFRGQRLMDAVYVHTEALNLKALVYLNRGVDARLDWLENGTADRYNVRTRVLRRRSVAAASRGRLMPLRFFALGIESGANEASAICERRTWEEVEKLMKE